jgi:hypothetical protein
MKTCKKCLLTKEEILFVKNKYTCKACQKNYNKKHYENNKAAYLKYASDQSKTPERKKKQKEYAQNNKAAIAKYQKEYREKNKIKLKEKQRLYNPIRLKRHKERLKTDPDYKIRKIYRNVLRSMIARLKLNKGSKKTHELLGYNHHQLRERIESIFLDEMSWDNYGEWHIDHIKPISAFEIGTPMNIVNGLDNLQPLWKIDNLKKSNNYENV